MFPKREEFPCAVGAVHWVTVGYVPHISQALEHTDKARLAVSDARTDLFQRCLAIVLRRLFRVSEVAYPVDIPGLG